MDETVSAEGFDWDKHNAGKIWKKHHVHFAEAEEVFYDENIKVLPDEDHSEQEQRYRALGKTRLGRYLFVVFTRRKNLIRVVSARDMHRKERRTYHEEIKEAS